MAEQQTKKKSGKTKTNAMAQGPVGVPNGTRSENNTKSTVISKNSSNGPKNQNRKKQETNAASSATANAYEASAASRNASKPAKKVNKTSEMLSEISPETVNTKLDEVLKTVRQLDNTCDFGRCRTKTSLIGQDCTLCQQRFCMKHQLPEIHGCGGAIKKEQRNEFLKPRPTLPISAALRRNEQKDAHSRLEQKLKEMSLARQKARK
ncbi:DNA-binding protein SMUBP-2 [Sitodiplosis mosellana]|uniref:DNA-binding protein SMUBP-2 n=1 Tax=Sitodiplosis mosellana TaxID=263140 RepID=UPI002443CEAE|nr:DNA-binding protein SMUBP-2 [Sitodiplosis mosellana]